MDLKLDPFGDLLIENDDLVLVDGIDAIRQDLDVRLKFFQGEWFLDTRVVMPYYQRILGEKPRLPAVAAIFREAVLQTPGIVGVTDFDIQFARPTRRLTLSFRALSTEGPFDYVKRSSCYELRPDT
jgi:hypothetical protein